MIGIFTSDIHFSHTPPIARSEEPDWYAAMERPMDQLRRLQRHYSDAPVLCAGDVFHTPNPPPELINWVCTHLPHFFYAIAGNHDLPNHSYQNMKKSAYFTATLAGAIYNINPLGNTSIDALVVEGFPVGFKLRKSKLPAQTLTSHVALIHKYIWDTSHCYDVTKVPKKNHYKKLRKKLKGYDVAVFGDNHIGFHIPAYKEYPTIFNCGSLMRRRADQIDYKPMVGLLMDSREIVPYYLDCSEDKIIDEHLQQDIISFELDLKDLIDSLANKKTHITDFKEEVRFILKKRKFDKQTVRFILRAMEQRHD